AVLAMTKANIETLPTLLTTYHTPGYLTECKIWEAARATSAAITLFDPIKLGRDEIQFVDASHGYNNPCEALIWEAERQFPGRPIMTLSIGAGLGDVVEISDSRDSICNSDEAQLCKHIIANVLVTYRPVTWDELNVLVEAFDGLEKEDVKQAVSLCGSFLTVHKNVVSFVHQSAKDYFLEKATGEILPLGIPHQHQTIFLRSLDILQKELRRDIYSLAAPGCLIEEVSVPKPDPLAAIGYSCFFWVDHLNDSSSNGMVTKNDEILAFLNEKYLQWLEALSLLKVISIAGRRMEKLKSYSQEKKAPQDLRVLVHDAYRSLLLHKGIIEVVPLQIYISALIFSPTNSLIRRVFSREEPDWIELKPEVEANWCACLRTLKGHGNSVTSVVFSNDGQQLASGSDDKTVKIWDATSGACLQSLEGYSDDVTSAVFSTSVRRPISPLLVDQPTSRHTELDHYCISSDHVWVLQDQQRLIWLPPSYRPVESAISRQAVGFSTSSRRIIVIRFRSIG
ncbi:hypothetical protein Cpir12675_006342, partial [Ceratocystis pirilliformis]